MNTKLFSLLPLITLCAAQAHVVNLKVHDENSLPVKNAEVYISFDNPRLPVRYDEQAKLTNEDGQVVFEGNGVLGASMRAKKRRILPICALSG